MNTNHPAKRSGKKTGTTANPKKIRMLALEKLKSISEKNISEKRKKGYDTYIAELLYCLFPSYIKSDSSFETIDDCKKCVSLFSAIKYELDNSEIHSYPDY